MSWWLRVRRAQASLIAVLGVTLALLPIGNLALPLPNLLGGAHLEVPLALLLPLIIVIVIASGLANGDAIQEAVASRPVYLFDIGYCMAIALVTLAACQIVAANGSTLAHAAGRNTCGYIGLMLLGRRLLGAQAAPILPLAIAIAMNLFGRQPDLQVRWWAWGIAASDSPSAVVGVVLAMIIGVLATLGQTSRATRSE